MTQRANYIKQSPELFKKFVEFNTAVKEGTIEETIGVSDFLKRHARAMRVLVIASACCLGAVVNASAADIKSISRLAAGPENILFVADWKTARVHAIALPGTAQKSAGTAFNVLDLEMLLSKQVGGAKLTVEDMVVRPGTAEVYVAVSYGAAKTPALMVVTSDHRARRVDLKAAKSTSIALRDAPTSNYKFWKETPERSFTVTDMKWRDGELFIAGLSNQDFASTLRRVKYPFDSQQSMTSVEIYHTGHNLIETRAPIRAMSFATWGGKPYLVAAYTCTPIVTIPLDELKDGAHVRGKTIAELGYGNTPADLIAYTKTDRGKTEDFLLLINFERGSSIIPVSQVEAASARPGIETLVPFGQIVGLDVMPAPLVGTHAGRQPGREVVHRRAPAAREGRSPACHHREGTELSADRLHL